MLTWFYPHWSEVHGANTGQRYMVLTWFYPHWSEVHGANTGQRYMVLTWFYPHWSEVHGANTGQRFASWLCPLVRGTCTLFHVEGAIQRTLKGQCTEATYFQKSQNMKDIERPMDMTLGVSPPQFASCMQSKTGGGNGLGMRRYIVTRHRSIVCSYAGSRESFCG